MILFYPGNFGYYVFYRDFIAKLSQIYFDEKVVFIDLHGIENDPTMYTYEEILTFHVNQLEDIIVSHTDKQVDKPTDKPADKPTDKPTDKPADKPTDKPADKSADKPTDKSADNSTDTIKIISHSFGCYLVSQIISRLKSKHKIEKIIYLCPTIYQFKKCNVVSKIKYLFLAHDTLELKSKIIFSILKTTLEQSSFNDFLKLFWGSELVADDNTKLFQFYEELKERVEYQNIFNGLLLTHYMLRNVGEFTDPYPIDSKLLFILFASIDTFVTSNTVNEATKISDNVRITNKIQHMFTLKDDNIDFVLSYIDSVFRIEC